MRILVVKMSSMGDIFHILPAITDAIQTVPDITIDWVVEENFAQIPAWHPAVKKVIPVAWRRWRKQLLTLRCLREIRQFLGQLRASHYDLIIDAQGLIKSALISRLSKGLRAGLSWRSAWESIASVLYQKRARVDPTQHAVVRMRTLFAHLLGYSLPSSLPNYGLDPASFAKPDILPITANDIVLVHSTTWQSKLWPEAYWQQLAQQLAQQGCRSLLPWGNGLEKQRAERIAHYCDQAVVLPQLTLTQLASVFIASKAVVAVDTGLGHMAAAFNVPCVSLYGPTSADEVGTVGPHQVHLSRQLALKCAPCRQEICHYQQPTEVKPVCFAELDPLSVVKTLTDLLQRTSC